jgi:uncharacterized phiE125 gp8 family phage protein
MTLQTIASMREFLSLGPDVSEASVLEQYGAYLAGATATPIVSLREAKAQLQREQDNTDDDAEIADFIADASAWVEGYTGHILAARDVTQYFDGWGLAPLRAWPIAPGATVSVTYTNEDGSPAVGPEVRLSRSTRPAFVVPWNNIRCADNRHVTMAITVRAGYETPADVPREIRRAMLVLISGYDNDREGGEIFAKAEASARRICGRLRLRRL